MIETTTPPFPTSLEDRLAELSEARAALMTEIESAMSAPVPHDPTRWSLAETVYHLYLAESSIARLLEKALQSGQRHARVADEQLRAEWEHIRLVLTDRQARANAPAAVMPNDAPPVAEAVERLQQSRQRLLRLLEQVSLDDLASISIPHSNEAIGRLTGAGWLTLIGYHERRHTQQIRELTAARA
ncbi:MAG: DinB family protein [Acidobacteriota bacterium]|nr:DinB family protein [Acidobacteriota bacterium]